MADYTPFAVKATDDVFGILTSVPTLTGVVFGASMTPSRQTEVAHAEDDYGDGCAIATYGEDEYLYDATMSIKLTDSFDLSGLWLGQYATGKFVNSISVPTDPSSLPVITFTGKIALHSPTLVMDPPTGKLHKVLLPAITINPVMIAQDFGGASANGFTAPTGTEVRSSTVEFSGGDLIEDNDGEGNLIALKWVCIFDGSISADFVACTTISGTAPVYIAAWTFDGDLWDAPLITSTDKAATAFWTGNASAVYKVSATREASA